MKRRYLSFFMSLISCVFCVAQNVIPLQGDPEGRFGDGHHNVLPHVEYDKYNVYVSSWDNIYGVTVIVKDADGNVIFRQTVNLSSSTMVLNVPEQYVNGRYKIEIICGSTLLYGYFANSENLGETE